MDDVLGRVLAVPVGIAAQWTAGAICYDACGGGWLGRAGAAAWLAGVAAALLLWEPLWQPLAALAAVELAILAWWLRLLPSHDRDWEPAVAVLPRVTHDGNAVTVLNVSDFDYPAPGVVVPRYDTRTYHLSRLTGLDLLIFTWARGGSVTRPWCSTSARTGGCACRSRCATGRGSGTPSSRACTGSRS